MPGEKPGVPFSTMNAEMPLLRERREGRDGHHDEDVADAAVRRERLRSVQHPAAVDFRGRRPHRRGIAAGGRLGQPPRADLLAARQRHEIALLLLFGARQRDVGGAQPVVGRHRQRDRRIDAGQLFDADAVVDGGHAGAAVLFRKLDAHQSERGELRDQIGGKLLRLIPFAHVRADLGFGELADAATEQLLLRGQTKVHRRSDSTIMDS